MLLIDVIEHGDLLLPWGVWLGTVGGWATCCMNLDRFRGMSGAMGRRWRIAMSYFGPAFFLGTLQVGLRVVPLGALCMLLLVGIAARNGNLLGTWQRQLSTSTTRAGGGKAWLASVGSWVKGFFNDSESGLGGRGPAVLFFKKDGSLYGGKEFGRDQSAIARARKIFDLAINYGATDVHLEPRQMGDIQIRYRVDGILQSVGELLAEHGQGVVTLLKVLADMDIAERRRPQDGTFVVTADGRRFDIRSATSPTQFGEKVVLRLLDSTGGSLRQGLESLGMPSQVSSAIRSIIHKSQGMLIVCGPTGSGKTTSVYAALSEIDKLTRNIVTIEDPIEYQLHDISQIAVNNAADVTFAKILRSVLRQDPDVLLVGEIRDQETAEIAMQAALTGHLVLTTIHANDTASTVTRLIDIGVDATLIQSTVTGVLAQRLLRVLCPVCKKAYRPKRPLSGMKVDDDSGNGDTVDAVLYKPVGCNACLQTGYRGRTGVFEFMAIDGQIRALLTGKPSVETIRGVAKRNGMTTMKQAAKEKVLLGITSAEEAQRVIS